MTQEIFGFSTARTWDYENGYWLTSHTTRFAKALAQYELYKSIVELPGHIVECGVYKGASLIRFATFREILENAHSRKIIGFDAFGAFPRSGDREDIKFIEKFERDGGEGIPLKELEAALEHKCFRNVELVPGDVHDTVPRYLQAHPEMRIAMLHLDLDVYPPSAFVLEQLHGLVVPGGIIVLDDYGTVSGATKAVDELLKRTGYTVKKLPLAHIPAYIRK